MAEELELNLSEEKENITNRAEERIKDLSHKVKEKAMETEAERQAREQAEARAQELEKERDFFKDFSSLASKYPNAGEYQDKILGKVKGGYAMEDAVLSVLNSEGKLPTVERAPIVESAGGGSASTVLPSGDRSIDELSQQERRQMLQEASESGELAKVIRNWGR